MKKTKLIRVNCKNLLFDKRSPRLGRRIQSPLEVWLYLKKNCYCEELAASMIANGYFETEPLIVIPHEAEKFIVVDGNRRLATIQGLMARTFDDFKITKELEKQFKDLPVIVCESRADALSYMSAHHLIGVRKWGLNERVKFIVDLIENKGFSVEKIQNMVGDKNESILKMYICHNIVRQVKKYARKEDEDFVFKYRSISYLLVAADQRPIRQFLGIKEWGDVKNLKCPIQQSKLENAKLVLECLFDTNKTDRIIRDSKDIREKLRFIFESKDSIAALKRERHLNYAFRFVDGEFADAIGRLRKAYQIIDCWYGMFQRLGEIVNAEERDCIADVVDDIQNSAMCMIWARQSEIEKVKKFNAEN